MSQHPVLPVAGPAPPPPPSGDVRWIFWLWLTPTRFFTFVQQRRPAVLIGLAICLAGVGHALERLDKQLVKASLRGLGDPVGLGDSWALYWALGVLVGCLLSGPIGYFIGGWWYRVRLGWCGVRDAEPRHARDVYVLARLVYDVPVIAYALWESMAYATPMHAAAGDDSVGLILLVFLGWSVIVSHRGVKTVFTPSPGRALVWFLVLPLLGYGLVAGLVGVLAMLTI